LLPLAGDNVQSVCPTGKIYETFQKKITTEAKLKKQNNTVGILWNIMNLVEL